MRHAKSGQWWETAAHRALANNSVSYTEKPDMETYMREWQALVESKSGERGVYNRQAAKNQAKKFGRRDPDHEFGTNPCSEIILRPYQFCNLTEVVVRATDTMEDLERKIRLATILGTIQSTYTKFPYSAKGVVYKYRRRTTAWCVTHRDNGQPFDDITQQRIGEVLLNIFVGSLYLLMLNGLTVLVYLLLLQLRALNHREQSRNWWIVPLAYMLAIAPIISALCVVIIKIR